MADISRLVILSTTWPGLSMNTTNYLDNVLDIWYYVALWSVVVSSIVHVIVSIWAYIVFRKYPSSFFIPILFLLLGALTGFVGGSVFGIVVAVIYTAGMFKLNTWIAVLWGLFHLLYIYLGSYSVFDSIL